MWCQSNTPYPFAEVNHKIRVSHFKQKTYLGFQQRQQATTNKSLPVQARSQMMRTIPTCRNIHKPDECPEGIVVKRVDGQEISVDVVACASPKVADFLGLDVGRSERWTGERRSGDLQDRQWRCVACEGFGYTGDSGSC